MEEWPILKQFLENHHPWDGFRLGKLMENCLWWEGAPSLSSGRNKVWWTDCNPLFPSPCITGARRQSWEGERDGGKVFLRSYFTSHYSALILLEINSINISNSSLSCPWQYLVSDLSQSLTNLYKIQLCYIFSLLSSCRGEWERGFGGCLASRQGQLTTTTGIGFWLCKARAFHSSIPLVYLNLCCLC